MKSDHTLGALSTVHHSLVMTICLLALLTSCSKQEASVSGSVTLNGARLTSGTVAFHSVAGGPTAYGSIKSDGSYTLQTGSQRGLKSGEYVVTVVATGPPEHDPNEHHMEPVGKLLTAANYGDVKTSPLRVTINPGSNRIPLELQ